MSAQYIDITKTRPKKVKWHVFQTDQPHTVYPATSAKHCKTILEQLGYGDISISRLYNLNSENPTRYARPLPDNLKVYRVREPYAAEGCDECTTTD